MKLLRNTDGADSAGMGEVEILNHLANVDLTTIDRSKTILKEGSYPVIVDTMELKETKPTEKNPKKGYRFQIGLRLLSPTKDEDNKDVEIDKFVLFDSVSLTPTEKYNPLERLADIQLATFGAQRAGFNPKDYLGQKAVVKVKVEDSVDFGKQNRLRWVPKKGSTVAAAASKVGTL